MKKQAIFWNVQRFFEPNGGPIARALGASSKDWTEADYEAKLTNIATCLKEMTSDEQPALLAFAEVETVKILQDLRSKLGWNELVCVDEEAEAPEIDGLDVALLYNQEIFEKQPLIAQSLAINNSYNTRDLLRVRLQLKSAAIPVEVVVCHWPSRVITEGRFLRIAHSFYLRNLIQSFLQFSKAELLRPDGTVAMPAPEKLVSRWNTPCFIMGDFNDEPYDESVRNALNSSRHLRASLFRISLTGKALEEPDNYLSENFTLHNPCWSLRFTDNQELGGTYYRSPEWRTYDQVIVSHGALLEESPFRLIENSVKIPRLADLQVDNRLIQMKTRTGLPNPFESDDFEGVSDHFPLLYEVEIG
jgi:endonuclease/exonuclease/phosphatase family metal-dependent hydrolase